MAFSIQTHAERRGGQAKHHIENDNQAKMNNVLAYGRL